MTEKVLGFRKKDVEKLFTVDHKNLEEFKKVGHTGWRVKTTKTVPVRLKSESVSLEWLKKWCKKEKSKYSKLDSFHRNGALQVLKDLLSAARKQVGEEK